MHLASLLSIVPILAFGSPSIVMLCRTELLLSMLNRSAKLHVFRSFVEKLQILPSITPEHVEGEHVALSHVFVHNAALRFFPNVSLLIRIISHDLLVKVPGWHDSSDLAIVVPNTDMNELKSPDTLIPLV